MSNNALYWGTIFAALALCILYNVLIAKKFHISRWKIVVITLIFFVFNWGITYLTAFVEAGLQPPGTANGVRAWVYVPFFLSASSLLFKIDFKRLCDALTPCLILGFAFAHVGCVFTGCCHGYPYEGFGAIYNEELGCNLFPIQIVESIAAYILFFAFVVYVVKSKFRVTGRQYPVMLIAYMGRIVFEFFRDNEKIFLGFSSLAFHSLFGGLVGAVWFFFTTPTGKVYAAKIKNVFRKLLKKEALSVLTKEEYKLQISEMQDQLTNPQEVYPTAGELLLPIEISDEKFKEKTKKTNRWLAITAAVSAVVLTLCLLYLIVIHAVKMATTLVTIFSVFSSFLLIYSVVMLIIFNKKLKTAKVKTTTPILLKKPDEDVTWMLYRKRLFIVHFNTCPMCNKKLHFSEVKNKKIVLTCHSKEKHEHHIPYEGLLTTAK